MVVFFMPLSLMLKKERINLESKDFMGQNTGTFMRIVFVHSEIIFFRKGGGGSILILLT